MISAPTSKQLGKMDSEGVGFRLDRWLSDQDPSKSRSAWQKKIKTGEIKVNGRKVSSHYSMKENDVVEYGEVSLLNSMKPDSKSTLKLKVLFEDQNYAVIDKPAGLVVHPGAGVHSETLTEALKSHFKDQLSHLGGVNRPGIVHRLDKGTSGIMVIAKNDETHRNLAKQFESKTIIKLYTALVVGHLTPKQGSIEAPLTRNEKHRQKITISTHPKSRYALTHYEVLRWMDVPCKSSLLKVRIETGRTHQIRVHCEAIGYPIVGDPVYGTKSINLLAKAHGLVRPFLHATSIEFLSPTTGKKVHYEAPLPEDLSNIIDKN